MAEKKEKVEYAKSTAQVDLETRLADDAVPRFDTKVNPSHATDDGYVGVSPEYQNAANETDEPLDSEEGGFADAEQLFADAYGDGSEPSEDVQKNYKNVRNENDEPPAPTPTAADVQTSAPAAGTTSPTTGSTSDTSGSSAPKSSDNK